MEGAAKFSTTCKMHKTRTNWRGASTTFQGFRSIDRLPGECGRRPTLSTRVRKEARCSTSGSGCATRRVTTMMPIGVPRVPYRTPKENSWQWVDIWNCLYRERIIFVGKAVDDEMGNQLVATMLYLDSENKNDLTFYINCSGGEVVPSLAIHDCMRHIESSCSTVGFGGCMGMSGFLLAVGKKGKRYVMPNTRIMLHHPSGAARGQASDIHNEAKELLYIRDYTTAVLSECTGQPYDKVYKDFGRNKYFNAQEAIEYGVVDQVIRPPRTDMFT
ncbi:hypothetical protein BSKO_01825 [Bryopsis sp. KO-2023]|nr:hypothetical protein BSKO_01825 [Bryopsis sp. KO-2023]